MKFFGMGNIGIDVDGIGTDNVAVGVGVYEVDEVGIDDIVLDMDNVGNCVLDDKMFTDDSYFP